MFVVNDFLTRLVNSTITPAFGRYLAKRAASKDASMTNDASSMGPVEEQFRWDFLLLTLCLPGFFN